ncbi:NAD(P)H-dependent flavin oxidoreductase [Deinococcus maricopensis]|uniref:Propionate 3-nitronate monooxygenase n=1 Tax=Deinococcus maricopensis (strain DSM 21211 / LMG 22137 / NRRL B-23946 / LB-34) TaxID=709986 RepID=E8UAV4_DEIML|nr:nitronate monooxygenase [Deinococcus maricopensis]ADV68193.1 2-nitropropane dioxygenase [Deinococcus maricopensis DSM 21211]
MSVLRRLGARVPVMAAPMAGGPSTPALVAAVGEAGGVGALGGAYLTPAALEAACADVRARTSAPFAVNLFVPTPTPEVTPAALALATAELGPFHTRLGLAAPALPVRFEEEFGAQFEVVLRVRPALFTFTFGRLEERRVRALQAAGVLVAGTATNADEARQLAEDGVDAIVAQGAEAGGHRGGWTHGGEGALERTLQLVRAISAVTRVPVIASGGLMSADDVRAALAAGALDVACGTAFLLAREAGTSAPYRAALRAAARAGHAQTALTRAFSGRAARGLRNAFMDAVRSPLPYPAQNALTRPLRTAGAQAGDAGVLSLWAGEGAARVLEASAAEILAALTPAERPG